MIAPVFSKEFALARRHGIAVKSWPLPVQRQQQKRDMMRHLLLSSLPVIALAAAAQAQVPASQNRVFEQPYWTKTPVIEALGRARLEVPPNRAAFSVTYKQTGKSADVAMEAAVERARLAYKAVKTVAKDATRVSTSVSVQPYYRQYRDKNGNIIENSRADKVDGYNAQASMNVTVLDVALAGKARAAALALGPEKSSAMRIYLERTAKINRDAYAAAVDDAAKRAKLSAQAAGAKLGRLMVLQEGKGPCLGEWTSRPGRVIRRERMDFVNAMASKEAEDQVLVTAQRKVRGKMQTVTITQADIERLNLPSDRAPQTVQAQVCAVYTIGQ